MRLRIHRGFFLSGLGLALLAAFLGVFLIAAGIFTYYWIVYGRMIDQRMAGHMYQTSARVFQRARPRFRRGDAVGRRSRPPIAARRL